FGSRTGCWRALTMAALFGCCACEAKPPFPVGASGLAFGGGQMGTYAPIYWLDNVRVLFAGYEVTGRDEKEAKTYSPPGLYIWDTASGKYERHAALQSPIWAFCFNDGFVLYSVDGDERAKPKTVM